MTEREKAIEEMANIINPCVHESCDECVYFHRVCSDYKASEKLYDAGYRKADDVRKETAQKIAEFIENNYSYDLSKEIRKKFCGVEVEE